MAKRRRKPKPKRKGKQVDEGLWSCLPPEIVVHIFRLLPLHHAIKAKAVCHQWRTLLDSILHQPQSLLVHGDLLLPVFLPNNRRSPWFAYHPASQSWRRFPSLAFLPFSIQRFHSSHLGLILLEESPSRVYVCNFSTHQHRLLPPVPFMPHYDVTCWYHLQVDENREAYSILAMWGSFHLKSTLLVRFDSKDDKWSPLQVMDSISICCPEVLFAYIETLVFLPESIFTVVRAEYSTWYLLEYDICGCVWVLVCKIHVRSAQIVSFRDTFMVVTLDRVLRQIRLHRFECRQLVLEAATGTELADFVVDCANHHWYTAVGNSCIYVGEREGSKAVVEYNAVFKTWSYLPLPDIPEEHKLKTWSYLLLLDIPEEHKEDCPALSVCGIAYELGITTNV